VARANSTKEISQKKMWKKRGEKEDEFQKIRGQLSEGFDLRSQVKKVKNGKK